MTKRSASFKSGENVSKVDIGGMGGGGAGRILTQASTSVAQTHTDVKKLI